MRYYTYGKIRVRGQGPVLGSGVRVDLCRKFIKFIIYYVNFILHQINSMLVKADQKFSCGVDEQRRSQTSPAHSHDP